MAPISDTDIADYNTVIREHGLDRSDFTIAEGPIKGPVSAGFRPLNGSVTIRYIPSGASRIYATGHHTVGRLSAWVYLFDGDLGRGQFE